MLLLTFLLVSGVALGLGVRAATNNVPFRPRTLVSDTFFSVKLDKVSFRVSDQFLSVTLDTAELTDPKWNPDIFPPRVVNMAKALSPAMLRMGGTAQDYLIFDETRYHSNPSTPPSVDSSLYGKDFYTTFYMSQEQWDAMNQFCQHVGWDFIFGLNVMLRKNSTNGSSSGWDPTNAKDLIEYTKKMNYKVKWELGNGMCIKLLPV